MVWSCPRPKDWDLRPVEVATRSGMIHGMIGRRAATGDEDALSSELQIGTKGLESRSLDIARRREDAKDDEGAS